MSSRGALGLAVVVGASGAIGNRVAALLSMRGYSTIGTYNETPPSPASSDVDWVHYAGGTGGESVASLRSALQGQEGDLATLVYCVGVPSTKSPVVDTSLAEFTHLYAINALCLVDAYAAIKDRARSSGATVVVVSSDATETLKPSNGAYSASKSALESLAFTLAKEEAPFGVRVNVLAPSLVDSPLARDVLARKGVADAEGYMGRLPWGRALSADEVAEAAVALGCDGAWTYASGHRFALGARLGHG